MMGSSEHRLTLHRMATDIESLAALRDFCDGWSRYWIDKGLDAVRKGDKEEAAKCVHYADALKGFTGSLVEEAK